MSRKIYAFGYSFTVACNALEACAHLGLPPHNHVTDVTAGLKNLCESVLGPDTFAPPSKPIFFGAFAQDRTYMHALGAVGVVTGDKEAIDEVSRLVKFENDAREIIAANLAEIERLGGVMIDCGISHAAELAAAKDRIAELEAAAKETNDRLVWQAETVAQTLEAKPASFCGMTIVADATMPEGILATPLAPLPITDPTPAQDEWAHLDRILRQDWPGDVPFATIRETVARAGYVMADQAIRNRAVKLGLRRTNPTAHQGNGPAQTAQTPEPAPQPANPGVTPPATASRLAKLIGAEAVKMAAQALNPDEISKELNAALGRNDQVTARQVTQVLVEMARLKRAQPEATGAE